MPIPPRAARLLQETVFALTPPTRMYRTRAALLRGRHPAVDPTARVVSTARFYIDRLQIGADSFIGHAFRVYGGRDASLVIGQACDIGPHVVVLAGTHDIGDSGRRAGRGRGTRVVIADGAWIGGRVTLVGPCEIGAGAVVAAGCVVRGTVPRDHLYLGPDKVRPLG